MVQPWSPLHGPSVARFVWPNRGQLCMAQRTVATFYSPTVATFVLSNCGQLCMAQFTLASSA